MGLWGEAGSPGGGTEIRHQSGAQTEALVAHSSCSAPQVHTSLPLSPCLCVLSCLILLELHKKQVWFLLKQTADFTRKKQRPSTKTRSSLKSTKLYEGLLGGFSSPDSLVE